jgi:hypothetical protein
VGRGSDERLTLVLRIAQLDAGSHLNAMMSTIIQE